jgi:hypothetical protein
MTEPGAGIVRVSAYRENRVKFVITKGLIDMSACPSNFRRNDVKRAVQAVDASAIDDSNNSFDKIIRKLGVV